MMFQPLQSDKMGFSPFGRVISGLDVALDAHNPTPGNSGGVDQDKYEELGNAWIRKTYPGINFITSAVVVSSPDKGDPRTILAA